jgi:hypothetical protein
MTTLAQVRTAWNTAVWQHATIQAITDKTQPYDVAILSMKDVTELSFAKEINAFTYVVALAEEILIMNQRRQVFTVDVRYYRELKSEADMANTALDAIETLSSIVDSQLGVRWSNTVDWSNRQSGPIELSRVAIASKPVYCARYKYLGFKNI